MMKKMIGKIASIGSIASLGFLIGTTSVAQMSHEMPKTKQVNQFNRIEQPLWIKGVVTAAGLGLISLELWWFLLSKPRSQK